MSPFSNWVGMVAHRTPPGEVMSPGLVPQPTPRSVAEAKARVLVRRDVVDCLPRSLVVELGQAQGNGGFELSKLRRRRHGNLGGKLERSESEIGHRVGIHGTSWGH